MFLSSPRDKKESKEVMDPKFQGEGAKNALACTIFVIAV